MGKFNSSRAVAALGVLGIITTNTMAAPEAEKIDPRIATLQYFGTGDAEHAPDFADATFEFAVDCMGSAKAAREAIAAISGPIWRAIATKDPAEPQWGDIDDSDPRKRGRVVATPPQTFTQNDGTVVRVPQRKVLVDTCAEAGTPPVAPTANLGWVFGATQSFSVRSSDLNWVESLVKTVQKKERGKTRNSVSFFATQAPYGLNSLTPATLEAMRVEMRDKARNFATGKGSRFELDKDTLGFESARYVGSKRGGSPFFAPKFGRPIARGKAPKVTVDLPITYTMYAETKNLLSGEGAPGPAPSEYEVIGRATAEADYASTEVVISARCQATPEEAVRKANQPAELVLGEFRKIYNGPATETDAVVDHDSGSPTQHADNQPVAWDEKDPNIVTEYYNGCTGEFFKAPARDANQKLPEYWQLSRKVELKTRKFEDLIDLVDQLSAMNTGEVLASEVKITVNPATAAVVQAKANELWMNARRDANSCLLDPKGAFSADARANNFVCAHIKAIRVGGRISDEGAQLKSMSRGLRMAPASPMAADRSVESVPETLAVELRIKPGETRPLVRMTATYEFTYDVMTKNHVPGLKPAPTPLP